MAQRNRAVLLAGCAVLAMCGWAYAGSHSTTSALATSSEQAHPNDLGTALLYTDNSPGIIMPAYAHQKVLRSMGLSVRVATEVNDFIALLSTGHWEEVSVFARYQRGEPRYAGALREYSRNDGGWVQFTYWYDNPRAPVARGKKVIAPLLTQTWTPVGDTVASYLDTQDRAIGDSMVTLPDRTFVPFTEATSRQDAKEVENHEMRELLAGVLLAEPTGDVGAGGSGSEGGGDGADETDEHPCNGEYYTRLRKCAEERRDADDICWDATGPSHGGTDNDGHPAKLHDCLEKAAKMSEACRAHAWLQFGFCYMESVLP